MPGRSYSIANTNYRFGFNGKEKTTKTEWYNMTMGLEFMIQS